LVITTSSVALGTLLPNQLVGVNQFEFPAAPDQVIVAALADGMLTTAGSDSKPMMIMERMRFFHLAISNIRHGSKTG
jgi:hypothetical protein